MRGPGELVAFVTEQGTVRIEMTLPDGQKQTLDLDARQARRMGWRVLCLSFLTWVRPKPTDD